MRLLASVGGALTDAVGSACECCGVRTRAPRRGCGLFSTSEAVASTEGVAGWNALSAGAQFVMRCEHAVSAVPVAAPGKLSSVEAQPDKPTRSLGVADIAPAQKRPRAEGGDN